MAEVTSITTSQVKPEQPGDILLTTSQVARRYGVDSSAVRKWVAQGKVSPAHTTPGGHHRFRLADIEHLLGTEATA